MEDEVMDEGIIYEIALEEEEIAEDKYCEEGEEGEEPIKEADCDEDEESEKPLNELIPKGVSSRGKHANKYGIPSTNPPVGPGAKPYKNESTTTKKYNALLTEAKELKGKNGEYKQALKQFRTMLAETVVFNSNLTYVTKLFMEHSTTKTEKEGIFKRFDNEVSTLKESKKLYKAIASELGSRKPMNESINNKIEKEVNSGTSKQLNESTVYVDTETSRIMDLIKRVDKK
jgi:hypothetical protein